jgi:type 1 fimbria pilin
MLRTITMALASMAAAGLLAAAPGMAASPPDLSGTYRCEPAPAPCLWPGHSPSVTQSGANLMIKSDQGDISAAKLTSDTTISAGPTFNSIGIIRADHSIDWSNGTTWRKQ